MLKPRYVTLAGFLLSAALLRILPHPWNFTPVGAMALFGGAKFRTRASALALPVGALFLSDWVLGFYSGMWAVYAAFAVIVGIGRLIRKNPSLSALGGGALA